VFDRTIVPRDFDVVEVPYPERGEPEHVRWKDYKERHVTEQGADARTNAEKAANAANAS
jgi:hypothetical protein